ncbi:DUF2779 domain-containing protein [Tumidithrix elongata RA019]|uniref:DUF2779 domain-containing protein n=1 Tax=Tumidithrix elongata BACA0141 TaxID=2716417 RepID=A0AAW9PY69_9CYAN|nr:DUF2779 domain-containing protein [Tumidithrix elongata RA019]
MVFLSKSDYKVAKNCPTKLYYKKLHYPTTSYINNYTRMLADGGFMIGKMARLLYPSGIEIKVEQDLERGLSQTKEALQQENIILFEPIIYAKNKLIRVDILIKEGNKFQLIEVKSKSFDSNENNWLLETKGINIFRNKKNGAISSDWRTYIEDVAYQIYVLQEMLSEIDAHEFSSDRVEIHPYLCMPDKSKTTAIDLAAHFKIKRTESQTIPSKFSGIEVDFTGDLEQLNQNHILGLIGIDREVQEVLPEVIAQTEIYLDSLVNGLRKIEVPLSKHCKGCEFRVSEGSKKDGFKECWGELAEVEPHIFDLYHMGRVGGHETPVVNELIQMGKVNMYDIPLDQLDDTFFSFRQLIQLEYTKTNREWMSEQLPSIMAKCSYPLHFIDFETSRMALPYHPGMRPYEQVAFQWSCHTIPSPGAEPIHSDWIDLSDVFPNFRFAEALMDRLGDRGTILTWATHENSVLRDIYYQMEAYEYEHPKLKAWLAKVAKLNSKDKTQLVDMNALTLKHYFHPLMKGRTSLKCVLPAIWKTNPYLHQIPWMAAYFKEVDGQILNPYETLLPLEISDKAEVITEGTGAMLAYQNMMYGEYQDRPEIRQMWCELLKQYCCLDTMAMVIIWTHWLKKLG